MNPGNRLVILSGPSGVGKGPLQAAVKEICPALVADRPILYTSRDPRVGEKQDADYHFRSKELVKSLRGDPRFAVAKVRKDWQAIDVDAIPAVADGQVVLAEVFHSFGKVLKDLAAELGMNVTSVFLLPLPPGSEDSAIEEEIRKRLNNRNTDPPESIEERAKYAPVEVKAAIDYTHKIVNPAGEDNTGQWGEFGTRCNVKGTEKIKLLGDLGSDARCLVEIFRDICQGTIAPMAPGDYMLIENGTHGIKSSV